MARAAVIVTGLPASGKTTLARALGRALAWPVLAKDDFLEDLFGSQPVLQPDQRGILSRTADAAFQEAASGRDRVVLVSHWRPREGPADTGTPTAWLAATFGRVIEVRCACPPGTATPRFRARRRHPGHLDHLGSADGIARQMDALAPGYPLDPLNALSVSTEALADAEGLAVPIAARIRLILAGTDGTGPDS